MLLVEREGTAIAGRPGWTFGAWVRDGHERWGHPTGQDLATHLTTLFPESRLRRFLEVRGVDELPGRSRGAAVALLCGLLYDGRAAEDALALLEPHRAAVPDLLQRAATVGLADPVLGPLAVAVLDAAHDGAVRLAIPEATDAAAFLEGYTHRGAHPSDELRSALAQGPATAFRWASALP